MEAFVTVSGTAAPLPLDNVSTDALIPSRLITSVSRAGYGPKLFGNWRYRADGSEDPAFVLNQPPYRDSRILIAGAFFGCGSSREMAVWALRQFGIRCVIAPSFAPIFRQNCLGNGVLPVVLARDAVQRLAAQARGTPGGWHVDLQACRLTAPDGAQHVFEIDADERRRLLLGLDPIALTLQRQAAIDAFVEADRQRRPWMWPSAG